jgi:hypothetical protein
MFDNDTAELMRRFNDAFRFHDPAALVPLVADDCTIENTNPAPDGSRHVGRDACLAVWQGSRARPAGGRARERSSSRARAVIRWRYRFGANGPSRSAA